MILRLAPPTDARSARVDLPRCRTGELRAEKRGRSDFVVHISRLADIENHGATPSLHKIYSLAAIYHLNPLDVFEWYDIPLGMHFYDGAELGAPNTHLASPPIQMRLPVRLIRGFDPRRTDLISRMVEAWGEWEADVFHWPARPSIRICVGWTIT